MDHKKDLSEKEILSLAKKGDNEALNLIISKYRTAVEVAVSRIPYSPIEREDLVQEGLIGLLAAVRSFDLGRENSFKNYCYICINNALLTALRKSFRQKVIQRNIVVPFEEEIINSKKTEISAEEAFLAQESVSQLVHLLESELSEFENYVLRMHVMGYSYKKIADKLGTSPKSVDNALQRIRKKLKMNYS